MTENLITARALLRQSLNSEAMRVIDAVMACHQCEVDMHTKTVDFDFAALYLERAADNFADYTRGLKYDTLSQPRHVPKPYTKAPRGRVSKTQGQGND